MSSHSLEPERGADPVQPIVTRQGFIAWLLSTALHFVLIVALGLLIRPVTRGIDIEPERTGGIVLVTQMRGERKYFTEGDAANSASQASASRKSAANPLPSDTELPVDITGLLPNRPNLLGAVGNIGDDLPNAGTLTDGIGSSRKIGGEVTTQVFGVQGVGSTFVYVFDRSGSMSGFEGRPLAAAKAELMASLASLQSTNQFQIIFYNERPSMFHPNPAKPPHMVFGTEQEKQQAVDFIRGIRADGGTRHMEALKLAVGMGPDVIFFLTDAEQPILTDVDLAQIRRWNRSGASIHAIEFGAGAHNGGDNFLVKLARENNGRHVYVDVRSLPRIGHSG